MVANDTILKDEMVMHVIDYKCQRRISDGRSERIQFIKEKNMATGTQGNKGKEVYGAWIGVRK